MAHEVSAAKPTPVLMVGFNRRFAPMAVRMKEFVSEIREPLAMHYRVNAGFLPADHWTNDPQRRWRPYSWRGLSFCRLPHIHCRVADSGSPARSLANPGQYSGDNLIIALRFENGSEGTISYLANGDRSYSKERIEVFGGGSVATIEDFRQLELVRHGRKTRMKSRWSQDKGHRNELEAFISAVTGKGPSPLSFTEIAATTLATLRIQQSVATGGALKVDLPVFLQTNRATYEPAP